MWDVSQALTVLGWALSPVCASLVTYAVAQRRAARAADGEKAARDRALADGMWVLLRNELVELHRRHVASGAARQVEKDHAAGTLDGEPQFPYVDWEYVSVPYADAVEALRGGAMEGAYALLKAARPELADAEDC